MITIFDRGGGCCHVFKCHLSSLFHFSYISTKKYTCNHVILSYKQCYGISNNIEKKTTKEIKVFVKITVRYSC